MKKRLLGVLISGLVLANLLSITETKSVLADSNVEQKLDVESFYTDKDSIVENEIIVRYKNKQSSSKILSYFLGSKDGESKLETIKVEDSEKLEERLEELKNDPDVELIQPNYIYKTSSLNSTSNTSNLMAAASISSTSDKQWYLNNLGIPDMWTQSTGSGVTVAVIDSGIDSSHEDLVGKVIGGKDFTGTGSYMDDNGYGTYAAGIIAADRKNNIGITGIAYDSKLLSVKVIDKDGKGETINVANGIKWAADNGAKILTINFGTLRDDAILKEAIDYAVSKGCIPIASSGDYGLQGITYPAAYDNVIAVGSTNEVNHWFYLSSYGKELDVVAPGVNISSTVPQALFPSKYEVAFGTSVSAAIVSGQVSMMVSKEPQLTVSGILNKIKNSSFNIARNAPDIFYGNGILDVKKAITGVAGQLRTTGEARWDDNTANNAQVVNSSKMFSNHLDSASDANWYKLFVPADTAVKISVDAVASDSYLNIFREDLRYPEAVLKLVNNGEYYITNHYGDRYYYVENYGSISDSNIFILDMKYLSVDDTSIPKDSTLKYSIDSPRQGQAITGNTLNISGWALSKIGIYKVEALIDNTAGPIKYGISRSDVFKAFSDYNNEQSGFSGSIDISNLPYGNHQLTLLYTDGRGVVNFSNTITFNIVDTLKYSIDSVKAGMNVTGNSLTVGGWALSKAGIAKVEAIVDNDTPVDLKYGQNRPDVGNVFKEYSNNNSGFFGSLDIKKYAYGFHILQLKVTYVGGRTQLTAPINFNIPGTLKYSLDTVRAQDKIAGTTMNIGGWALSKSGIAKVEAIIDNRVPIEIKYGTAREDVYNAFKDYNNKAAGFSTKVDVSDIAYGGHMLYIKITEANGKVTVTSGIRFEIQNPIISIDTPRMAQEISGTKLQVSGWALSSSGIAKIELLVNKEAIVLNYGNSRIDVYNAYPSYNNKSGGFSGNIDISKLTFGNVNLSLRITDKAGRVWSQSPGFSVNIKDTKKFSLDTPYQNQTVNGKTLNVAGWAISNSKITKVEALIDNVPYTISYGASRIDVYNVFKNYNNKYSGFGGTIDISKLSYGEHNLSLRFTDGDGRITVQNPVKFNISNTLKYSIDSIYDGKSVIGNSLNINGWALSKVGIAKIEAIVDEQTYAVQYNLSRPDVYKIYKDYNNEKSGFVSTIDISKLSKGRHSVVIRFTDGNGRTADSSNFNVYFQ